MGQHSRPEDRRSLSLSLNLSQRLKKSEEEKPEEERSLGSARAHTQRVLKKPSASSSVFREKRRLPTEALSV